MAYNMVLGILRRVETKHSYRVPPTLRQTHSSAPSIVHFFLAGNFAERRMSSSDDDQMMSSSGGDEDEEVEEMGLFSNNNRVEDDEEPTSNVPFSKRLEMIQRGKTTVKKDANGDSGSSNRPK